MLGHRPARHVGDAIGYNNSSISKALKGRLRLPYPVVLKIMDACQASAADRKELETLYSSLAKAA